MMGNQKRGVYENCIVLPIGNWSVPFYVAVLRVGLLGLYLYYYNLFTPWRVEISYPVTTACLLYPFQPQ